MSAMGQKLNPTLGVSVVSRQLTVSPDKRSALRRVFTSDQTKTTNNKQMTLTPLRHAALGPIGPPPCLSYVVVPRANFALVDRHSDRIPPKIFLAVEFQRW